MPLPSSPSSGCGARDGSASVAELSPAPAPAALAAAVREPRARYRPPVTKLPRFAPRVSSAGEEPVELALLGTVEERVPLLRGEPHGPGVGTLAVADLDPSGMAPCLHATTPVAGRAARHDPSDLAVHHCSSVVRCPRWDGRDLRRRPLPHSWLAACLPMTSLGEQIGHRREPTA